MPSYLCKCNTRIDYTEIPAAASYHLVEDGAAEVQEDLTHKVSWTESTEALRCPACDRFWVFWSGMSQAPTEYESKGIDDRPPA